MPLPRGRPSAGVVAVLFMYLLLSHTQMVAVAQLAALSEAYPEADPAASISFETDSSARRQAQATDGQDMAQSLADLPTFKAYQSLANAVTLQDVGSGANLQRLKAAVTQIKQAYQTVSGLAGPQARIKAAERIIGVEQLLFKTVSTELGNLGLIAGLVGLATFIMLTVTGALVTAGGSVLLSTQISGLQTAVANRDFSASDTNTSDQTLWFETASFQAVESSLDSYNNGLVDYTLTSRHPVESLDLALNIIQLTSMMLDPNVLEARDAVQAAAKAAADQVANSSQGLLHDLLT